MWQGPFGTMWQVGPGVHHLHILDLPPENGHIITLISSAPGPKTGNPRLPAQKLKQLFGLRPRILFEGSPTRWNNEAASSRPKRAVFS